MSREGRALPRTGRVAPRDIPWASPSGNPLEQPHQPPENPAPPPSSTQINPIST